MKQLRRILSAVLAFVMLLSVLPAGAEAATAGYPYTPSNCPHAREHEAARNNPSAWTNGVDYFVQGAVYEPTCTQPGRYDLVCVSCGFTLTVENPGVPALGHSWSDWKTEKEATCAAEGYEYSRCSRCGKEDTRTIDRIPHTWGEWVVTSEETASTPGVQSRTCEICGETEQVESFGITVQENDTGIEVYILQALLTDHGAYRGPQDGVFSAALTRAVKEYQASNDLEVTGVAHGVLFQLLTNDMLYKEQPTVYDGMIKGWESGLTAFAVSTGDAVSLNDGTHEVTYTLCGVRYYMGEERTFKATSYTKKFPIGMETCHLANESYTCDVCGYAGTVPLFSNQVLPTGGWTLMNLPVDLSGLEPIEGLSFSDGVLWWKPFENADNYRIHVSRYDGVKTTDLYGALADEVGYFDLSVDGIYDEIMKTSRASYRFSVTALRYDKDACEWCEISLETSVCAVIGNILAPVANIRLDDNTLSWTSFETLPRGCVYRVVAYNEEGEEIGSRDYQSTVIDVQSLNGFYWYEGGSFYVEITVIPYSTQEDYLLSETVRSEVFTYERPHYYRVNVPCNVRSGPGTNYERIGGLSEGDIIRVNSTGSFLQFDYNGQSAYVMATCCTEYNPKFCNITFLTEPGDYAGNTYVTRYDGTLDRPVFDELHAMYDDSYPGQVLDGWTINEISIDFVNASTVFTTGETLYAQWEQDPNYVFSTLLDCEGCHYETVTVKKGTPYSEFLPYSIGDNLVDWYSEDGQKIDMTESVPSDSPEYPTLYAKYTDAIYLTVKAGSGSAPAYASSATGYGLIGLVPDGTVVRLLEYRKNGSAPFHVTTEDGIDFWLTKEYVAGYQVHITFDANGGWVDYRSMVIPALETFKTADLPIPVKTGCTFVGWRDSKTGELYEYGSKDIYTLQFNTELVAEWKDFESVPMLYTYWWESKTKRLMYVTAMNPETGKYYAIDVTGRGRWLDSLTDRFSYATLYSEVSKVEVLIAYGSYAELNMAKTDTPGTYVYPSTYYYLYGWSVKQLCGAYDTIGRAIGGIAYYFGGIWNYNRFNSKQYSWVGESTVTITLNAEGGAIAASEQQLKCKGGSTIRYLPTPVKQGAAFNGWYTDPVYGELVQVGDVIYTNTRLYAHYKGEAAGYYTTRYHAAAGYKDEALTQTGITLEPGTVVRGTIICSEATGDDLIYVNIKGNYFYFAESELREAARMTVYRPHRSNGKIYAYTFETLGTFAEKERYAVVFVTRDRYTNCGTAAPKWHNYEICYQADNCPEGFAYIGIDDNYWFDY